MIRYIPYIIFGFLSGSVMYSVFLPKIFFGYNVLKDSTDKNPGSGNIIKDVSVPFGLFCLFLDIQKGFVPVFIALKNLDINNYMFIFIIIAPVLGHSFSPFLKFAGGKAIAVTYGVYLALFPKSHAVIYLAGAMIALTFILNISPHSLRVIISMAIFSTAGFFLCNIKTVMISIFLSSAAVIFKHIQNYNNEKPSLKIVPYNKLKSFLKRI